jgi:hypothetical protein
VEQVCAQIGSLGQRSGLKEHIPQGTSINLKGSGQVGGLRSREASHPSNSIARSATSAFAMSADQKSRYHPPKIG